MICKPSASRFPAAETERVMKIQAGSEGRCAEMGEVHFTPPNELDGLGEVRLFTEAIERCARRATEGAVFPLNPCATTWIMASDPKHSPGRSTPV